MSTPHLPFPIRSEASLGDETRRHFRTKTVATRLTHGELAEVEAAAETSSQSLAEWLRETALRAAVSGLPIPLNYCLPRSGLCVTRS